MRPLMSCRVAKLALPMTRLRTIRPATATSIRAGSSASLLFASCASCRSPASASRRKSLGYAGPRSRKAASFARRSATIRFSSSAAGTSRGSFTSHALLQARGDEVVEIAIEHGLRIAPLDIGAQVLDARLVEHVRADLVAPADVGLRLLELLLLGLALAELELVQARLEHRHGLRAVAVLRAVVLTLHDDAGRRVRDPHSGVGLVDVLAACAGGPEGVDAKVRRVDLHLDRLVDLRVDEHAGEGGVAARVAVERTLAHQA